MPARYLSVSTWRTRVFTWAIVILCWASNVGPAFSYVEFGLCSWTAISMSTPAVSASCAAWASLAA